MKRFLAILCIATLVLSMCFTSTLNASGTITTDKDWYVEGEPILVTAEGEGKDWVGIYLDTDVVQVTPSILWYYVEQDGNESGDTKNIFDAEYDNQRNDLESLPAGNYVIYLLANDGYEIIDEVEITIYTQAEAPMPEPTEVPTSEPTPEPTSEPTMAPTVAPTTAPTEAPIAEPTDAPEAEEGGCGSSVMLANIVILAGTTLLIKRRK